MNREEALNLCRMAKAICPAQAIDDFTPDAWALVLEDDRYEDAKQALKELSREQPFVHVSEIVKRIKRIRSKRVADFGVPDAPAGIDPNDTGAYQRWLKETTEAIADGTYQRPEPQAIEKGRDIRELGQAKSVDSALALRDLRAAHAEAKRDLQAAAAEEKRAKDEKRAAREAAREADLRALARKPESDERGAVA